MPTLWSSTELASHDFPNPAYLVEPVIPQGGIVIIHGKPNIGKSQLVLTLAHAINVGTPFLGRWPTRQGNVVVVQVDMTGQIQQDRVARVVSLVNINSTYWLVEEDGGIPVVNIENFAITHRDLVRSIQALDPVLVCWDTLRKVSNLDENDSRSAVKIFAAARQIAPFATHMFVHHNRKESRDPDAVSTADEDFMGNMQWMGSADTTMGLREIGTPPKRLALQFHKARTASDLDKQPVIVELDMKTILLQGTT